MRIETDTFHRILIMSGITINKHIIILHQDLYNFDVGFLFGFFIVNYINR